MGGRGLAMSGEEARALDVMVGRGEREWRARREARLKARGLMVRMLGERLGSACGVLTSCSNESSNTSSSPSRYSRTSSPTRMLHVPSGTSSGRCAVSRALVEPQWGSRCAPPCKAEKVDSPMPRTAMSHAAGMESSSAAVMGHRLRLRDICTEGVGRAGARCVRRGDGDAALSEGTPV